MSNFIQYWQLKYEKCKRKFDSSLTFNRRSINFMWNTHCKFFTKHVGCRHEKKKIGPLCQILFFLDFNIILFVEHRIIFKIIKAVIVSCIFAKKMWHSVGTSRHRTYNWAPCAPRYEYCASMTSFDKF